MTRLDALHRPACRAAVLAQQVRQIGQLVGELDLLCETHTSDRRRVSNGWRSGARAYGRLPTHSLRTTSSDSCDAGTRIKSDGIVRTSCERTGWDAAGRRCARTSQPATACEPQRRLRGRCIRRRSVLPPTQKTRAVRIREIYEQSSREPRTFPNTLSSSSIVALR